MDRRAMIALFVLFFSGFPLFSSDTTRPENTEIDEALSPDESEAKGIIPDGGVIVSSPPITPITALPEKDPYQQALEELAQAHQLSNLGKVEAASDVALQAYDDLMSVYVPRRNKRKRSKLRADRREAATLYLIASMAYIKTYADKTGNTAEARVRLGDLRDVAINYPELNKKLNRAIEKYR